MSTTKDPRLSPTTPDQRGPTANPTPQRPAAPDAGQRRGTAFSSLLDGSGGRAQPKPSATPAPSGGPSARTIDLVQKSWAKVMPISDAAAALFYDRLFELDPSLRTMFKPDMAEQKKKLMQTLNVAVEGLSNVGKLVPVLQALGVRHAGYMVAEHHYDLVGESLLWTLREGLGDAFTKDVEAAWTEVYTLIADVMKKAAAAESGGGEAKALPVTDSAKKRQAARGIVVPTAADPARQLDLPPESVPVAGRTLVGVSGPGPGPASGRSGISPRTIEIVQQSWAKVMPISDAAATLFYDRLFELDPSVRTMFKTDMADQKKKLMQTLAVAVDGLSNLGKLIPVLQALGVRHAGYMVEDHHYDLVGESLLWTLREGLGEGFTKEVEQAWTDVYGVIAGVMKTAAAAHGGAATLVQKVAPTLQPPMPKVVSKEETTPIPGALDEDAATISYDPPSKRLLVDEAVLAKQRPSRTQLDTPAEPAPQAAPALTGLVVPLSGQDMTLHVHLKLDSPPLVQMPAPRATEDSSSNANAFGWGAILSMICVTSSMAATFLLAAGGRGEALPPATQYGVPLLLMLLVFGAFSLGHLWSRSRAPAEDRQEKRRR